MDKKPLDYETPGGNEKKEMGDLGKPQVVFDTVIGPNVRLKDNLIQLGACVSGAAMGGGIGMMVATDRMMGLMAGGFLGLVGGLFISGIAIGVWRFVTGVRKKR